MYYLATYVHPNGTTRQVIAEIKTGFRPIEGWFYVGSDETEEIHFTSF